MSDLFQALARVVRSPAFKLFLITVLILLLFIPMSLVSGLVGERQQRASAVSAEIARLWGGRQVVSGPYLVVPYTVRITSKEGDKQIEQIAERRAVFTPDQLDITSDVATKILHRGIYDVPTYTAKLHVAGHFPTPDLGDVVADPASVRWRDASFALAISDVAGLKATAVLKIDDRIDVPFEPSLGTAGAQGNGIHAKLIPAAATLLPAPDAALAPYTFSLDLVLAGSSVLQFAPAARTTHVTMTSDWRDPSFTGAFLPTDRSITPAGFKAEWTIPHLARSVPSAWALTEQGLDRFGSYYFGVSLFQPVGFYDLVNRAMKYEVLFVSLAFFAVFVLEVLSKRRVHSVQYLFAGVALSFFYVLLLALAEHIGFGISYLAASIATGLMLSLYVARSLGSARSGWIMAATFAILYGLLYLTLRLEDYALLAGTLVGFVALTIVMFTTLGVDWSGRTRGDGDDAGAVEAGKA